MRAAAALVALGCLAARPAPAQTPSAALARFQDDWRWVRFQSESGLPSGRLFEVLESSGTTWVVTDAAVAWFDNYRWRRPPPLSTDSGLGQSPRRLTPDGRGGAFGIAGDRLVHVTRQGIVAVPTPGLQTIRSIAPLADDDMLVLADSGLFRLQAGRVTSVPLPAGLRRGPDGRRLLRTHPGHVWLIGAAVWRWEGDGWVLWLDRETTTFRETEAGGVLATAGQSPEILEWSPSGRPHPTGLTANAVSALSIAPGGDAMAVFFEGRAVARQEGRWSVLSPLPDPLRWTRQIVHRDNGDFWGIGPRGLFLFRGSGRRWIQRRLPGRNEFNGFVNAVLPSRAGDLWLGTGDGLVREDSLGTQREIRTIHRVPLGAVTALAEDTAGGIWVGSGSGFAGAFRLTGSTWRHYGPADGLDAPRVHRIVPDAEGNLWFLALDSTSTGGPGAFRWNGSSFRRVGPAEGLAGGRVYAFQAGPDSTLWFGTDQGLSRLRSGQWTHWPATADGVAARVYTLAVDHDGSVWFGHRFHGLGLGHLSPDGTIERLDFREDSPGREVSDVAIGPDSSVWFTTHGGMGRIRAGTVSFFGRESGLENARLWPVYPMADRVIVGGEGVVELLLAEERTPPPVVDLAPVLAYPSEVLLRWTPLSYWGATPSAEIETRRRVDEGPWSEWTLARQISLFRLSPGSHRVEVQAKGLFGEIATTPASVTFQIPRPWYRRPTFLIPAGVVLLAFVALATLSMRRLGQHRRALEGLNATLAGDIEERRRAEAALEESRRALQRIADSVPSILFRLRIDDGRIEYVNREVERILGLRPDELIGRASFHDLIEPASRPQATGLLERLRTAGDGEIVEGETVVRALSGQRRTLLVRSAIFTRGATGAPESVLSVCADVTERRHLEIQLVQAQKMETVGRLAGGVAHDFNNILTAIIGYAELAKITVGTDGATLEDLGEITRAAERARTLTSQLLTFARRQMIEPRVVDVNGLVTNLDRMVRRLIGADVELVLELASGVWPVRADPSQLEQVLVNLAVNARDAMPAGGRLVVRTENAWAWNGVGPAGERLRREAVLITVSDSGQGMTPAVASHIFEPFFTTKDPGQGTGLGLSTCYGIVQQAGGVIAVDTAPGRGTTFVVALPRVERPRQEPVAPADDLPLAGGSETILLAEDEDQVRRLSSRILRQAGYQVIEACNGREALELLAAAPEPPDLLLSDVVMPEMNGPELWAAVRDRHPALKVLFVSGYTQSTIVMEGLRDQTLPFLAKPFTGTALTEKVRQVLDGGREEPGPAERP